MPGWTLIHIKIAGKLKREGKYPPPHHHGFLWVILGLKTEGGHEIRQYGRALVLQGRASIGGASVELLRVMVVVVVVPQKIEIDFVLLQDPRSSERLHLRCRVPAALLNGKGNGLIWCKLERSLKAKGHR